MSSPLFVYVGKVYTRFQTKTAQKTLPDKAAQTYIAYIREDPPPPRVYSDPQSHRILYWIKNEESMKLFAGIETEGSRDGLASPAEFCKPAGLCVKFDHLFYSETSIKRNLPKCPLHRGL